MNVSVLVMSCDNYSDIWKPFYKLYKKYWKNDYPIYLGTETKSSKLFPTIQTTGSWTKRVRESLEQIDTEYVIFLLDDFFIRNYVDQERIDYVINHFKDDTAMFNFEMNYDITYSKSLLEGFKLRINKSRYLCSCQPSIWDRKKFIEYLDKDMTPWEWEMQIIDTKYKHYINNKGLIIDIGYYDDRKPWGIVQGKWARECQDLFKKEEIEVDFNERGFYN